jgi:hypothetical protein
MRTRRAAPIVLLLALAVVLVAGSQPSCAQLPGQPPSGYSRIAAQGFNDPYNSYAWSMGDLNGDLYVGTGRFVDTFNIMWEAIWSAIFPGQLPPATPTVPQAPFLQQWLTSRTMGPLTVPAVKDAALYEQWKNTSRAEIWRYRLGSWTRVHQARLVTAALVTTDPIPTFPYTTSESTGFRSMNRFTDAGGATALYAFSGGLSFVSNRNPRIVSNLIFRSTTGTNWIGMGTPLAMGTESRASLVHSGKLYVGVGNARITPAVWRSANPVGGTGTWAKVLDFGTLVHPANVGNDGVKCLGSFNGRLYVGTQNRDGFQVWASTVASPTGNANAQIMCPFSNHLYVGTVSLPFLSDYADFKGCEIIRIRPDNTWELVVGSTAAEAVDLVPGYENRQPISGEQAGFGNPMNFYCWNMVVHNGRLHAGTFDATIFLGFIDVFSNAAPPEIQQMIGEMMAQVPPGYIELALMGAGCDLYSTPNGVSWQDVDLAGLGNPENYGIRTMHALGPRMFLGTANPFEGCEVVCTPPPMYVVSPNGGESWRIGRLGVIRWPLASPLDAIGQSVRIEISRNGGATWSTLAASAINSGAFTWKVTKPVSSACRIRITNLSYPAATDTSDANFRIY